MNEEKNLFYDSKFCFHLVLMGSTCLPETNLNNKRSSSPVLFGLSKVLYSDKQNSLAEHEVKTEYLGKEF